MDKLKTLGLFFGSLLLATSQAVASEFTLYNMAQSVGGGSLSGFIKTNTSVGPIGVTDILDYDFSLFDGTNTFELKPANSKMKMVGINVLKATVDNLSFDFSGQSNEWLIQNPDIGLGLPYLCFFGGAGVCPDANDTTDPLGTNKGTGVSLFATMRVFESKEAKGDVLIGATTPLPSTLPLFASGLGALGLLGWRRRRKVGVTAAA